MDICCTDSCDSAITESADLNNENSTQSPSNSGSRSSPPPLPPCRICGERSSGFHYGANTCEACKGFFRRTLKKQVVNFRCICKGQTKSNVSTQKSICPACRYERCLAAGMSKTAIKIGRYTLTRKTQNIREVKRLEQTEEKSKRVTDPEADSQVAQSHTAPELASASPSTSGYSSSEFDLQLTPSSNSSVPDLRSRWTDTDKIDKITSSLTQALNELIEPEMFGPHDGPEARERRQQYLEQYHQQMELFGDMVLSREEFWDFYNCTGIDLDNRLEMMKEMFEFVERKIKDLIAFAKLIPGFSNLSLEDQANLIKNTRIEQNVVTMHRAMDEDSGIVQVPWGSKKLFHKNELHKYASKDFFQERYCTSKKFKTLELSVEEEALVRALMIVSSDRCPLENPTAVQEMQYEMMECLEYQLSKREDTVPCLLSRIISAITAARNEQVKACALINKDLLNHPMLHGHGLIKELIT